MSDGKEARRKEVNARQAAKEAKKEQNRLRAEERLRAAAVAAAAAAAGTGGRGTPDTTKPKRRAGRGRRAADTNERQLGQLLAKARSPVAGAPVHSAHSADTPSLPRRGRRGATISLYGGIAAEAAATSAEPAAPAFTWQLRLLAKRFPKCSEAQIVEALQCYGGDTDKAGIICERYARQSDGVGLGVADEPLSIEELDSLGLKQLRQLARRLRFRVGGNAVELRQRLAALVGLTPDVMVRLEWVLDAALAAKLPSIDREGAAIIRQNIAEGRFTAVHYITMYTERLRLADGEEPEPEPEPKPKQRSAVTQAEHQIHVRGIGVDGWDGTEEGVGRYENEESLEEIFGAFGTFIQATIRHRIADGQNTSWALVTMGDLESVDRALAAPAVMAGTNKLVLNRYSKKQAAASTGAMARVQKEAGLSREEVIESSSDGTGCSDLPPSEHAPLGRRVYRRLRKARCGDTTRMRTRLVHAARLRQSGRLSATLGPAEFGFSADGAEVPMGSTWKRASQLLQEEEFMDALRADGVYSIRALEDAVIRSGLEPTTPEVGSISAGEVFEVLEEGTTRIGQKRLRMSRGWISMTNKSGKPLMADEAAVQLLLAKVPLLQELDEMERAKVAQVLEGEEVAPGLPIIVAGDQGDALYFLEQGDAVVKIKGDVVARYHRGDYFGELALLTNQPRKATVLAGPDGARCLKLGRDAFDTFASKCTGVLEQRREMYEQMAREETSETSEADSEVDVIRAMAAKRAKRARRAARAAAEQKAADEIAEAEAAAAAAAAAKEAAAAANAAEEHAVDSWYAPSTNWSAQQVMALAQQVPSSPPGDNPSPPRRAGRSDAAAAQQLDGSASQYMSFYQTCPAHVWPGSEVAKKPDADMAAYRADVAERREHAGRVGWQICREIPDKDIKPVWLSEVGSGKLAMFERLARKRS